MHQRNVFGLAGVQHVAKAARAGGVTVGEWQTGVGVAYDAVKWTLLQGRVLFDVEVAALFTEGGVRDLPEQVFVRDCRKSKYQNQVSAAYENQSGPFEIRCLGQNTI